MHRPFAMCCLKKFKGKELLSEEMKLKMQFMVILTRLLVKASSGMPRIISSIWLRNTMRFISKTTKNYPKLNDTIAINAHIQIIWDNKEQKYQIPAS